MAAAEHTLMPSPQTVAIGNFNAATKPALTIDSGDTVVIETAAAMEPAEIEQSGVVPASAVPQYVRDIYREVKDRGPGPHVLTGPIYFVLPAVSRQRLSKVAGTVVQAHRNER